MFAPVTQVHRTFVGDWNITDQSEHLRQGRSKLFTGHVNFDRATLLFARQCRHVLIVRDPYDYVLAQARYLCSDSMAAEHSTFVKTNRLRFEEIFSLIVFGSPIAPYWPSVQEIFMRNAVAWLALGVPVFCYEDVVFHLPRIGNRESDIYFAQLLSVIGFTSLPEDWRERVRHGANPLISASWRYNLKMSSGASIPDHLSEGQRQLVDVAYPGLRACLGYA
jgi:hypothetical protein